MVDVPICARVECADGTAGRSVGVAIDPMTWRVTHFLVQESGPQRTERPVPVSSVVDTTPDLVRLRCTKSDLAAMPPLAMSGYAEIDRSAYGGSTDSRQNGWPHIVLATTLLSAEHMHIPLGELIVRQPTCVRATDGQVGQVDEFLVDPTTRQITHLVLRERHPSGQVDVMVPISAIERAGEDIVCLRLDRNAVGSLPAVSVERWHGQKAA